MATQTEPNAVARNFLKNTTLRAFTAYATVLEVNLEALGAPPGTHTMFRFGKSKGVQVFHTALPQPEAEGTRMALTQFVEALRSRGFERIWMPISFPDDPSRKPFDALGFEEAGSYLRMDNELREMSAVSRNGHVTFSPWSMPAERFAELYDASRVRAPYAMDELDKDMVMTIYVHEIITSRCLYEIHRNQQFLGATTLNIWGPREKPYGSFDLYLTEETWRKKELLEELLYAIIDHFKGKPVHKVCGGAEQSQKDRIALLERFGFKTTSTYQHLLLRV